MNQKCILIISKVFTYLSARIFCIGVPVLRCCVILFYHFELIVFSYFPNMKKSTEAHSQDLLKTTTSPYFFQVSSVAVLGLLLNNETVT